MVCSRYDGMHRCLRVRSMSAADRGMLKLKVRLEPRLASVSPATMKTVEERGNQQNEEEAAQDGRTD